MCGLWISYPRGVYKLSLVEGNVSDFELGYLSGMLDADGSITVSVQKDKYLSVQVRYYNNDKQIIDYLIGLIGEEYCGLYINDRSGKVEYQLNVKGIAKNILLADVRLRSKEKKRKIALEILIALSNKEFERYSYLRQMWEREIIKKEEKKCM